MAKASKKVEWPTLAVIAVTYGVLALSTTLIWAWFWPLGLLATTLAIVQYSSLQHEVLHGHPFRSQAVNEMLVFMGFTIFVPYIRFRDTHLQHHFDPALTDPYDDPEANYMDPAVWSRISPLLQRVLRFNNTLFGRILIGPAISTFAGIKGDLGLIRAGERSVARAWGLHLIGVALVVIWLLTVGSMPIWAYGIAAYFGYGILKIRTFLEHRAHDAFRARTVIVEDKGPLAFLFLNNNLHVVHHCQPNVAWYELPAIYAEKSEHYQRRNESYLYSGYAEIFWRYFFRAKDPVPHPVWPVRKSDQQDAA